MDKLNRDVLLGCIGGGTVLSLVTWLVTYGTLTQWQGDSCSHGWLGLGGFALSAATFPAGFLTSHYFERRARVREAQRKVGTALDAGLEAVGFAIELRDWWKGRGR